jgi:ADP-heptose:LPS heptosyltransferase
VKRRTLYLRFLWWLLALSWVDWLCARLAAKPVPGRILLVRLDAIGDYVLWSSYAAALRSRFPRDRYHITLVGNEIWTGLARDSGIFDEVWSLSRRRFVLNASYRFRVLRRTSKVGFETAIHPTYARDFLWGDSVIRCSGAEARIGYEGDPYLLAAPQRWLSDRWYSRLVSATPGPRSALERNADFLRAFGVEPPRQLRPLPAAAPVPKELAGRPYFLLAPGASNAIRRWPVDNFAEVGKRLHEKTGWTCVICGSAAERPVGSRLATKLRGNAIDLTGRTSVAELVSLVAGARFLLTNESGPLHIAALMATPALVVAGGGHFGQFVPYPEGQLDAACLPQTVARRMPCFGCDWNCIYPLVKHQPAPCVAEVSCDEVWELICRQLVTVDEPVG